MINIIFGIYVFLDILAFIVIIDVILSWLAIFQIQFRPVFIASILDPLYSFVKKHISTTLGPIDFTALIVMFVIFFFKGFLIVIFPEIGNLIQLYTNI